jgi:hypothetical protein
MYECDLKCEKVMKEKKNAMNEEKNIMVSKTIIDMVPKNKN